MDEESLDVLMSEVLQDPDAAAAETAVEIEYAILGPDDTITYDCEVEGGTLMEGGDEVRPFWSPVTYSAAGRRVGRHVPQLAGRYTIRFRKPKQPDPNWEFIPHGAVVTSDCEYFDRVRCCWRPVTADMVPGDWQLLQFGCVLRRPRLDSRENSRREETRGKGKGEMGNIEIREFQTHRHSWAAPCDDSVIEVTAEFEADPKSPSSARLKGVTLTGDFETVHITPAQAAALVAIFQRASFRALTAGATRSRADE